MTKACLIFLHIPKSAGMTLGSAIRMKYLPSRVLRTSTLDSPIEGISDIPYELRSRARLVWGHIHYGVHSYIPQECRYITMLRDPIKRVISLYKYVLGESSHPLHEVVTSSGIGLEEYVETRMDQNQTVNGQTRQIAGIQEGEVDRTSLELAKGNLERFAVVGLTERFDESFILLRRQLGWKLPIYVTRNVSRVANDKFQVSERTLDLIREHNELDLELVAHAHQLLSEAIAEAGRSFPVELRAFKRLNRISDALGGRTMHLIRRRPTRAG